MKSIFSGINPAPRMLMTHWDLTHILQKTQIGRKDKVDAAHDQQSGNGKEYNRDELAESVAPADADELAGYGSGQHEREGAQAETGHVNSAFCNIVRCQRTDDGHVHESAG